MKKSGLAGCLFMIACAAASDPPKEQAWLRQVVGEWTCEAEAVPGPGQPPQKLKGTESGHSVGDWAVLEGHMESPGGPVDSLVTLGYDPDRKAFVGAFICSQSHSLVRYEGTLAGKVLTLETEAPNPSLGGKMCKYRETVEIQGEERKVWTSLIEMDGKWIPFLTIRYQRNP